MIANADSGIERSAGSTLLDERPAIPTMQKLSTVSWMREMSRRTYKKFDTIKTGNFQVLEN